MMKRIVFTSDAATSTSPMRSGTVELSGRTSWPGIQLNCLAVAPILNRSPMVSRVPSRGPLGRPGPTGISPGGV